MQKIFEGRVFCAGVKQIGSAKRKAPHLDVWINADFLAGVGRFRSFCRKMNELEIKVSLRVIEVRYLNLVGTPKHLTGVPM